MLGYALYGAVSKVSTAAANHISSALSSHANKDAVYSKDVGNVGKKLQPQENLSVKELQKRVPTDLDLHYITENIVGMPEPSDSKTEITTTNTERNTPQSYSASDETKHSQLHTSQHHVSRLKRFLNIHHQHHILAVNVSDNDSPSHAILESLQNQILNVGWVSAESSTFSKNTKATRAPSILHILEICYALTSYQSLSESNTVSIYCHNGKARTGIVIACYLKFQKLVPTALHGFQLFVSRHNANDKNGHPLSCLDVASQIPPSLKTFFHNFDDIIHYSCFPHSAPLLIRAVTIQGVPVEDMPRIDIYDCKNGSNCVYSSTEGDEEDDEQKQWIDEDGFYRVNKSVLGDFVVMCRFGGRYVNDDKDPSKILFRYANNTGLVSRHGIYELPKIKVDMTRRYADSFDEEDFLMTLMYEEDTLDLTDGESLPLVYVGKEAIEEGWGIIGLSHIMRSHDAYTLHVEEGNAKDYAMKLLYNNEYEKHLFQSRTDELRQSKEEDENELTGPLPQDSPYFENPKGTETFLNSLNLIDFGINTLPILHDERTPPLTNSDLSTCLVHPLSLPSRNDIVEGFERKHVHKKKAKVLKRLLEAVPWNSKNTDRVSLSLFEQQPTLPLSNRSMSQNGNGIFGLATKGIQNFFSTSDVAQNLRSKNSRDKFLDNRELIENDPALSSLNNRIESGEAADAFDILMQLSHTGVNINDLLELKDDVDRWAYDDDSDIYEEEEEVWDDYDYNEEFGWESGGELVMISKDSNKVVELSANRVSSFKNSFGGNDVEGTSLVSSDRKLVVIGSNQAVVDAKDIISKRKQGITQDAIVTQSTGINAKFDYNRFASSNSLESFEGVAKGGKDELEIAQKLRGIIPGQNKSTSKDGASIENVMSQDDLPLKEDPKFMKYIKMLIDGFPIDEVKYALKKDGMDPSITDLDPNKSHKSQVERNDEKKEEEEGVPEDKGEVILKEDPEYVKYFKMLKVGLPVDSVKHALKRDGKDPSIMDLDPNKSLKSQVERNDEKKGEGSKDNDEVILKEDPEYVKYFKMLKVGLPVDAVKHALKKDGKDPSIMDLNPNKSLKSQTKSKEKDGEGGNDPALKDDPEYVKYFKMLKMGLPMGAVQHAMKRDGKDPSIMDLDPNKSVKSQMKSEEEEEDTGPALKDDPEYVKYFKMLKMGLPMGAVQHAVTRDGKDPSIMELDPNKSVKSQKNKEKKKKGKKAPKKPKKKVRRKKIYWTPIEESKISKESIWSLVQGTISIEKLDYDTNEFETLFTETSDNKKKEKVVNKGVSKAKKSFQVIDAKRAQNGGILLSRIKTPHDAIAEQVDSM